MIRTKLFMALALTGFGAAALGINASLPGPAPPRLPPRVEAASAPVVMLRAMEVPEASQEVMLDPVTIYSRSPARRLAVAAPALVPCSDWRTMASGPSGRGVRALCVPGSRPPTSQAQ
jgi:hypothetical protein